jgi:hypothetical protein
MSSDTWSLLLVGLTACVATGAAVAWRGWRGRQIDDHPLCRRCGFDLVGKPADSTRCAECGADLSGPRAVRVGHRARRPALLAIGAELLVVGLIPLAIIALVGARGVDVQTLKPLWWVRAEALGDDPAAAVTAFGELQRRLVLGQLSGKDVESIVDDLLAWQADANRPWLPTAGDFIETARDAIVPAGTPPLVSSERWSRYAQQAGPRLTFTARPRARAGDAFPVVVVTDRHRAGSGNRFTWGMRQIGSPAAHAGTPPPRRISMRSSSTGNGALTMIDRLQPLPLPEPTTRPMPREVTVRVPMDVTEGPRSSATLASWTSEGRVAWVELPATQPSVVLVDDPALRPAIERAVTIRKAHLVQTRVLTAFVDFRIGPTPVPLAYDVFLRTDAREWKLTPLVHPGPGGGTVGTTDSVRSEVNGFAAEVVDVVLRPNPDAAATRTLDIDRVWSGEVVLRDVKIDDPAARQRRERIRARYEQEAQRWAATTRRATTGPALPPPSRSR